MISRMQEETGGGQVTGEGHAQKGEEEGSRIANRGDRSVLQKLGRETQTLRSWVILRSATATGTDADWRERRRTVKQRRE
jgi:hypothetical protein